MNRSRCICRALFATLILLVGISFAWAGPGNLDVRFGIHGQTQIPGQQSSGTLAALPDGRILVFGVPADAPQHSQGAIAAARLSATGTPDVAFGPGGHILVQIGGDAHPFPSDALLLGDGRILVAGYFMSDVGDWGDQYRLSVPGWLVRLTVDGTIDPTFGIGGVARAGPRGIDRIVQLADGAIAAGAPGLLERLEPDGAPVYFPGSEASTAPTGSGDYATSALVLTQDGSVIASSGYWPSELSRVSASGIVSKPWGSRATSDFSVVTALTRNSGDTRVSVCGSSTDIARIERWQDDGSPDAAFAPETAGRVDLGIENRQDFKDAGWGEARCRFILPRADAEQVVVGDWNKPYEYGSGHLLLAHLDAAGLLDPAFDPAGNGRELTLGAPDHWGQWYVAAAVMAPDGAALVLAHPASSEPDALYYSPGELQSAVLARVEVATTQGAGSLGFNDAAIRIAERRPGELQVYRSGGAAGSVSVRYEMVPGTAVTADMAPTSGMLSWGDGDASPRVIALVPIDDDEIEGEENFRIRLSDPTGGAGLGVPEIEVTIEDDEALRALQFATPAFNVNLATQGSTATIVLKRPAATPGPVVVRYAVAPELNPQDGTPRPRAGSTVVTWPTGNLRWSGDDISDRTIYLSVGGAGDGVVALADISGALRQDNTWKAAPIKVTASSGSHDPPPPSPPPDSGGGGGALSLAALLFLALCLLLRTLTMPVSAPRLCAAGRQAGDAAYFGAPSRYQQAP